MPFWLVPPCPYTIKLSCEQNLVVIYPTLFTSKANIMSSFCFVTLACGLWSPRSVQTASPTLKGGNNARSSWCIKCAKMKHCVGTLFCMSQFCIPLLLSLLFSVATRAQMLFLLLLLFTFSLSSVYWEGDSCTSDKHTHTHTYTHVHQKLRVHVVCDSQVRLWSRWQCEVVHPSSWVSVGQLPVCFTFTMLQ